MRSGQLFSSCAEPGLRLPVCKIVFPAILGGAKGGCPFPDWPAAASGAWPRVYCQPHPPTRGGVAHRLIG